MASMTEILSLLNLVTRCSSLTEALFNGRDMTKDIGQGAHPPYSFTMSLYLNKIYYFTFYITDNMLSFAFKIIDFVLSFILSILQSSSILLIQRLNFATSYKVPKIRYKRFFAGLVMHVNDLLFYHKQTITLFTNQSLLLTTGTK